MKVVHHSNYIRWMEEARVYYLDKWGYNFRDLEASGLISPVVSVTGRFVTSAEFTDEIIIYIGVSDLKSAKFVMNYRMIRESDGALVFDDVCGQLTGALFDAASNAHHSPYAA